jgi:hypothetical protein
MFIEDSEAWLLVARNVPFIPRIEYISCNIPFIRYIDKRIINIYTFTYTYLDYLSHFNIILLCLRESTRVI